MLIDYHTHNRLCRHAEGDPVDYARAAMSKNLPGIGFSDHAPMPEGWEDDWHMAIDAFEIYLERVAQARKTCPEIPTFLGLEVDFLPGEEAWVENLAGRADFDYLIGAVHYLDRGWVIDHPDQQEPWQIHGVEKAWERYWNLYSACVGSGLFDFCAHPDLVKKFGHIPEGDLAPYYLPTIEAAVRTGTGFEINTAGLHKDCAEAYPTLEFLKLAREADIPLVFGSDAHAPDQVGRDFGAALALARHAGYTDTLRFEKRQPITLALPQG